MAALFSPRSNHVFRRALVVMIGVVVVVPIALMVWVRTPLVTGQGRHVTQPIPFDHRVHVAGLHIDCRYCHDGADRGAFAGLPSTEQCLPCHSTLWQQSAVFAPIRQSLTTHQPLSWQRVNRLPDFVFFNHAIHAKGGIGCESCHGRVDRMAQVRQAAPLTMSWCLDCHRNPEPHRRPADALTEMSWHPTSQSPRPAALGAARIREITTCSACHR